MMALEEERGFSGIEKFKEEKPDVWGLHAKNNKSAMGPDLVGLQWVEDFAKGLYGKYIEENLLLQIGFHKEGDMLELHGHHRDMAIPGI
jgi:lipoyl(octanoyl) transferase